MSYNTKNYFEQGGEKLVIGGEMEIKEGATVTGLDSGGGTFPIIENQSASTAEDLETLMSDFNALLAKLKASGIMTAD